MCAFGCRGAGGNGCPTGKECSSTTNAVGECVTKAVAPDAGILRRRQRGADAGTSAMPDAGGMAGSGAGGSTGKPPKHGGKKGIVGGTLGGGGCNCRAAGDGNSDAGMLAIAIAALWWRRKRTRQVS